MAALGGVSFVASAVAVRGFAHHDHTLEPPTQVRAVDAQADTHARPCEVVEPSELDRMLIIKALLESEHTIGPREIRFKADPSRPGTALEQFADVFAKVVASQRQPPRDARSDPVQATAPGTKARATPNGDLG